MKEQQIKQSSELSYSGFLTRKPVLACVALLIASLMVMASAFFFSQQQASVNNIHIRSIGELRMLSQQMAQYASEASDGKEEAFPLLKDASQQFEQHLQKQANTPLSVLPFYDNSRHPASLQLSSMNAAWVELKAEIDQILPAEETVLSFYAVSNTLSEAIPQLQLEYNEVLEILVENGVSADQIAIAQRQPWLAERIMNSLAQILAAGEESIIAADSFGRDTQLFGRVLNGMLQGNAALQIEQVTYEEVLQRLIEIADIFSFVSDNVDEVLNNAPELFQVRTTAETIFTDSRQLLQQTSVLANTFFNASEQRQWIELTGMAAGLLALLAMGLITLSVARQSNTQERQETRTAENTEHKVLQTETNHLLNEISDLTRTEPNSSTVGQETADSVLISVERLRALINTIRQTALAVDEASLETRATADVLSQNARQQCNEINAANESVNEIANTIHQVSDNASNSARVSERAVHIATNGGLVVQNAIEGMTNIREYIQNTSRRIKHLSESSQEISDIIALINDIADQTNILSLNAAIQASMAGEAGRGFAVVADEVQRLSERVSEATRQASGLISAVRADTHEAVTSMEHTATEVVHGVRLAQDAGIALEEIEQISSDLTLLIQGIADTTRGQADTTARISTRMNTIRDMTFQASSHSESTEKSIGNLTKMALDMRQSVADFTLPETES